MPFIRSHLRITDTQDLSAILRCGRHRLRSARVLNLSEGGMLITGSELDIGSLASFELTGPEFASQGLAEVAHRTTTTTGLRFVRLDASTDHRVRDLIADRRSREQLHAVELTVPGAYLG